MLNGLTRLVRLPQPRAPALRPHPLPRGEPAQRLVPGHRRVPLLCAARHNRWSEATLHAGPIKAYVQLALALSAKAIGAKASCSKRREFDPATAKYDFRVFLLKLGLIGDAFKTARLHLMAKLSGSAAWKGERRDTAAYRAANA